MLIHNVRKIEQKSKPSGRKNVFTLGVHGLALRSEGGCFATPLQGVFYSARVPEVNRFFLADT